LFGGQYLYVVADLGSLRTGDSIPTAAEVTFPLDLFASVAKCIAAARSTKSAVWGCGAKGVMFSHHCTARGFGIDLAIDINPMKQGRFLAGSGIPVVSPELGLARLGTRADIFVMNSNYLGEIQSFGGPDFNYIAMDQI
jgi:hypothetical protein